jgi:hypothetical protein
MRFKFLKSACLEAGSSDKSLDRHLIESHFAELFLAENGFSGFGGLHCISDIYDLEDCFDDMIIESEKIYTELCSKYQELINDKQSFIISLHEMNSIFLQGENGRKEDLRVLKLQLFMQNAVFESRIDDLRDIISKFKKSVQTALMCVVDSNIGFCDMCMFEEIDGRKNLVSEIVIPPQTINDIEPINYKCDEIGCCK